ncbi:MAG: hypothetical protein ABSH44_25780 [Bryobacteraceae bacterium]
MNSRRWITALAVLALFAGLASAQVADSTAVAGVFQCSASLVAPPLRAEGLTELVGDIVLTCTGGAPPGIAGVPAVGSTTPLPTANFTVSFSTYVTSRLLNYTQTLQTAANTSEALLLIDEPGSGLPVAPPGAAGFGPEAAQTLCGTSGAPYSLVGAGIGGCVEYVQQASEGDFVMSSSSTTAVPAANVFAGVVNVNQVTFYGIPILRPALAGVARVFRMTNLRVNANTLPPGTTSVWMSISISGSTSMPVNQPVQVAGFPQPGFTFQVRTPDNSAVLTTPDFSGCVAGAACPYGILRFSENFGTAAKLRTVVSPQNVPGAVYNTESGFFNPDLGLSTAGLADFATRLKASFQSVPAKVHVWVGTSALDGSAALTKIEGAPFSAVTPTANYSGFGAVQLDTSTGSAIAVWEVTSTVAQFDFPVWIVFDSHVTPAALSIAGNAAPNQDNGAFPMPDGGTAQDATYPVPRFTSSGATPQSIIDDVNRLQASGAITLNTNSLLAKLNNALADRNSGKCGPAGNVYAAFINEVMAQTGKGITPAAAAILIADAQYLEAHCP